MARLYQKRGVWYAWGWTAKGERWVRSTRQRDRRAATVVARQLERDAINQADDPAHPTATLTEACVAFLRERELRGCAESTLYDTRAKTGHLVRLLDGDRLISTLEPPAGLPVVSAYVEQRIKEGAKRTTIAKEMVMLRMALKVAAKHGRFRGDPALLRPAELRESYKPRRTWLTPEQVERLLPEVPEKWRGHVEGYVQLGVRRAELWSIAADDVDLVGNQVHVRGTKTEKADRWIPLTPRARKLLVARMGVQPMFERWNNIHHDLAAAAKRAGLPRTGANDLRRTFASLLLSNGVTSSVLKELMGHSTTKQIDLVYGTATEKARQAAVALHPSGAVAGAVARMAVRSGTKGAVRGGKTRKK